MKTLLATLLLFLAGPAALRAATINADSCSQQHVQAALGAATAQTTLINIPAGTCRWAAPVSFTVPSGNTNLTILGGGNLTVVGGGDATVIVDDYPSDHALFSVNTGGAPSSFFRLAGLTFQGGITGGGDNTKWSGIMTISGNSSNVRLDHLHFNLTTYSPGNNGTGMAVFGAVQGVMDHCLFDASPNGVNNLTRQYQSGLFNGTGEGDQAWAADTSLGGGVFMFLEDNVFNGGIANDCTVGGRFVARRNAFNSTGLQTHPTGGGGRARGCRAWEIYQNTFTSSNSSPDFNIFFMSAGTGVIWGNTSPAGYQHFVTLHSMRRNNNTYGESPTPNGWGYCGTSFNGTGSAWDQNTDPVTGYACLDQPGRGKGDLLRNSFPNTINAVTNTIAWPRQALEPVYEWLNAYTGAPGYGNEMFNAYESEVMAEDRDYYLHTPSFNGTRGTGSGPLASRPSACSPLTAYWAADTNTLYQCSTPNTWTVYYRPYTYPHPLTQGAGGDFTPPAKPKGLRLR